MKMVGEKVEMRFENGGEKDEMRLQNGGGDGWNKTSKWWGRRLKWDLKMVEEKDEMRHENGRVGEKDEMRLQNGGGLRWNEIWKWWGRWMKWNLKIVGENRCTKKRRENNEISDKLKEILKKNKMVWFICVMEY